MAGKRKRAYERELDEYVADIRHVTRRSLDRIGFFEAPASIGHHLAERGGLARHSVNVTRWLIRLTECMGVKWPRPESVYIVGMLHDVVKATRYGFRNFGAEERIVRRPIPYPGHGEASVAIISAELGLALKPEEAASIMHHMGAFNLQGGDLERYDMALDLYPRHIIATHTADMMAARVDEADKEGGDYGGGIRRP